MTSEDMLLQFATRRHFFSRCGVGLGKLALLSLLSDEGIFAEPAINNPMQAKPGHFPADSVVCIEIEKRHYHQLRRTAVRGRL